MTRDALRLHYTAVADASPVPVLLYQVPLRLSTVELPTDLVAELSAHPNVVGMKDSRGDIDLLTELVERSESDFQVLVGSGALLQPALSVGAVGGIVAVGLLATSEAARIPLVRAPSRWGPTR